MKDVCSSCSAFDKNDHKTEDMKLKQENDRKEINAIRTYRGGIKKHIDTDKTIAAAAFDLEEVLPLQKTNEGDIYYSRQLNNYNLSLCGYHDKTGHNYLWNGTTAKRPTK